MQETNPEIDHLSYEQAFSELENIVTALEAGSLNLEESMSLFERGRELASYCANLLDSAELRVQSLSNTGMTSSEEEMTA
jgi:exodeoxyribonuclease VII small subunit